MIGAHHVESVGKQALEQSGKNPVNENEAEFFAAAGFCLGTDGSRKPSGIGGSFPRHCEPAGRRKAPPDDRRRLGSSQ
jgi:hypothetical protein